MQDRKTALSMQYDVDLRKDDIFSCHTLNHARSPTLAPPPHGKQRSTARDNAPNAQYRHQPAIPDLVEDGFCDHGAGEGEDVAHEVVQGDGRGSAVGHEFGEHCGNEGEDEHRTYAEEDCGL